MPTLLDLFKAGVHFGHQSSRWYPKMEPFIYAQKNGIHVINLEKTLVQMEKAHEFIKKIVANGGSIMFLSTKKQAQPIIKKYAQETAMPYISERWIGGCFTNFQEISKLIRRYNTLRSQRDTGELNKYTKKERLLLNQEIEKLEKIISGVSDMKKIPDAVFMIDLKKEKTAVLEAHKKSIPIIAVCDTNTNPEKINYPIPGNDDGIKSIELLTKFIADCITEGLEERKIKQAAKPKEQEKTQK